MEGTKGEREGEVKGRGEREREGGGEYFHTGTSFYLLSAVKESPDYSSLNDILFI